jgi:hypothetical protein
MPVCFSATVCHGCPVRVVRCSYLTFHFEGIVTGMVGQTLSNPGEKQK